MIPVQPATSHWTAQQWQAIHQRGTNLLVAAAAGSGKTAVLVERIVQRVTSETTPMDVDRLLVVTFTNAAAAEMRKRIGDRLEDALNQQPHSLYLKRQRSLLHRASISTIHAFCMQLLQRYSYLLEIDPQFRIANEGETALLQEEVLDQVLEEAYGEGDRVYDLADHFSRDRTDQPLYDVILRLYQFARSYPWPDQWLQQQVTCYANAGQDSLDELTWTQELRKQLHIQLEGIQSILEEALQIVLQPGGPVPYLQRFQEELNMVQRLVAASESSWLELYQQFQELSFERLPAVRKTDDVDDQLKTAAQDLRNLAKERLQKLHSTYFQQHPEQFVHDLVEMAPLLQTLVEMVQRFSQRYQEAKRRKGVVDFSDLEHYALQLLQGPNSGPHGVQPSEIALQLQEQYEEIYVDEYQDTNLVQETILQLIARGNQHENMNGQSHGQVHGESEHQVGNLFMVGDVKQSIYRFRLADPTLFLEKYKTYGKGSVGEGERIDLNQNFRSRAQVLDATNFIFQQLMDEEVGEINYDEQAALHRNALYPETEGMEVEVHLLDRKGSNTSEHAPEAELEEDEPQDLEELDKVQLEARWIAQQIRRLMGHNGGERFPVYNGKTGQYRPLQYRDIVILMRSAANWAPIFLEEFKHAGIPVYAELGSGYFAAMEVQVMLALLQVIDNPYQDIPLASVLRSPIVGCDGEALTQIRLGLEQVPFYEAVQAYVKNHPNSDLGEQLARFLRRLELWRTYARRHGVADLISLIYSETHYDDFVGGLPGGKQRQANLRALYDRARQYEETSYRGLFRFLRFIQRLQDQGGDMGTARSLGEQEDVVRVMTIHKSKGLEFPVVFVAGLNKWFNLRDLSQSLVLHQKLGMGLAYVNTSLRITYPTIAQLAIQHRLKLEMLAEEMRVLYVALTRAKEKLILVGSVNEWEKSMTAWRKLAETSDLLLPAYDRTKARSYLDWLGPIFLRHRQSVALGGEELIAPSLTNLWEHSSSWQFFHVTQDQLASWSLGETQEEEMKLQALQLQQPIARNIIVRPDLFSRLQWHYPYPDAERYRAKQAVTELKRLAENADPYSDRQWISKGSHLALQQPRFLQGEDWLPTEKGSFMHLFMQHVPLQGEHTREQLEQVAVQLVRNQFLTEDQAACLDYSAIVRFFQSPLGQRLVQAKRVYRELPFSYTLSAMQTYPQWQDRSDEPVLIQGVIDALFQEEDGWVLLDYKTDWVKESQGTNSFYLDQLQERYRLQLTLYREAVEAIGQIELKGSYLYFFHGGLIVEI
ncbi:helicase-exonuclease AddAB subunit AddA [Rubeoparvulum massiliense]|uniref:helicase-exonuclease AddAB subunit AddA n=1 Tax=Rubeoparvulum massiliense TaxID=1631346 RepID=UPI00065E4BA6|nr:helicase-exonuclease AddAB subunit AddA [Rubeoparvulum massiliense]